MKDWWADIPNEDWWIAASLGAEYPNLWHDGLECPTPNICGRFYYTRPWSHSVQLKINEIKHSMTLEEVKTFVKAQQRVGGKITIKPTTRPKRRNYGLFAGWV